MERNLRLYPVFQALRGAFFWLPVFFLYFLDAVGLERALLLEAIYYVTVVVLEVPSGWFSDRIGRRTTLLLAMICEVAAALTFALTGSFEPFIAAQMLKAAGMALLSGTDSALLYDSLAELGREGEIAAREGRAFSASLASGAAAAAVGGLAAGFDLRIAWVLTALTSAAAFAVALRFVEPRPERRAVAIEAPVRRVLEPLFHQPALAWLFVFSMGMMVLEHVPFEFFQPYLDLLWGSDGSYALTPAVSGLLAAAMALLGAAASANAARVRARFGAASSLIWAMAVELVIIAAMASTLHVWVMTLILLRNVPMGIFVPLVRAEVHPRVSTEIRATYFSVQSLAGRLAFAGALWGASVAVGGEAATHAVMGRVLTGFFVSGLVLWALLGLTSRAVTGGRARGD